MRDAYEKKLADAAEAARKALESAQRERDDLIEAAKKDAAMRLAGAEGSAKSQMEDLRKKWVRRVWGWMEPDAAARDASGG